MKSKLLLTSYALSMIFVAQLSFAAEEGSSSQCNGNYFEVKAVNTKITSAGDGALLKKQEITSGTLYRYKYVDNKPPVILPLKSMTTQTGAQLVFDKSCTMTFYMKFISQVGNCGMTPIKPSPICSGYEVTTAKGPSQRHENGYIFTVTKK